MQNIENYLTGNNKNTIE